VAADLKRPDRRFLPLVESPVSGGRGEGGEETEYGRGACLATIHAERVRIVDLRGGEFIEEFRIVQNT
jgi:hypothetical protein